MYSFNNTFSNIIEIHHNLEDSKTEMGVFN